MPLESKSRDKGKDPQIKYESPKSQNPTKLLVLAISFIKPIKSWYEAIIKDEETKCS
jgi:hypothetical protein